MFYYNNQESLKSSWKKKKVKLDSNNLRDVLTRIQKVKIGKSSKENPITKYLQSSNKGGNLLSTLNVDIL